MVDDEAKKPDESVWISVVGCLIMLILLPVIMWCMMFAVTWIGLNFPWHVPNPIWLAECVSTGRRCELV